MSISINSAFKNVFSDRYNKKNLFFFFLIVFICLADDLNNSFLKANGMLKSVEEYFLIFKCISAFFLLGIYFISLNNAIHNRQNGVFPNFIKNFMQISLVSLRTIFCGILSFIILTIPFLLLFLIFGFFSQNNVFSLILFVILCILFSISYVFLFWGIYLVYSESLNWKDIFAYKKIYKFIMKTGASGGAWFIASKIWLPFSVVPAYLIVFGIVWLILSFLIPNEIISYLILYIMITAVCCIYIALDIDLMAQLFDELREKKIIEPLPQDVQ